MTKVTILNGYEVVRYFPKGKASIIRICDLWDELVPLKFPYDKVLTMQFYDIEPSEKIPVNWNYFSEFDGRVVMKMFESIEHDEELVIHCHAGISRSPAVALSFAWFMKDEQLEKQVLEGKYIPNKQVLRVMSKLIFQ